jgi:hypothetical protein
MINDGYLKNMLNILHEFCKKEKKKEKLEMRKK